MQNNYLTEYYECLRANFISFLKSLDIPELIEEKPSLENFDTYLDKLQQLCTDSYKEENKALFATVKQAFQNFPVVT